MPTANPSHVKAWLEMPNDPYRQLEDISYEPASASRPDGSHALAFSALAAAWTLGVAVGVLCVFLKRR